MINIKIVNTVAVLSGLLVSGSAFAGGGTAPSEDVEGNSPSHGVTVQPAPAPAPTAAELEEQLKALQLQTQIAEQQAKLMEEQERLAQAQARLTPPSPPPPFEGLFGAFAGGRSSERIDQNVNKEFDRFNQSFANFLGGKGWKHDKRLAREEKKKALKRGRK